MTFFYLRNKMLVCPKHNRELYGGILKKTIESDGNCYFCLKEVKRKA
jgi:hypothetical protein